MDIFDPVLQLLNLFKFFEYFWTIILGHTNRTMHISLIGRDLTNHLKLLALVAW